MALGAFNNPASPTINESIVQWCSNWIVFHLEKLLARLEINGLDEEIGLKRAKSYKWCMTQGKKESLVVILRVSLEGLET